jgi:hypothetical protein
MKRMVGKQPPRERLDRPAAPGADRVADRRMGPEGVADQVAQDAAERTILLRPSGLPAGSLLLAAIGRAIGVKPERNPSAF